MMLNSSLCDYSDAFVLANGTIVPNTAGTSQPANNIGIEVVFKNCAPFTDCISEINNTQIDNAKDIDVVMPMYNLIKYSDSYSKTFGSLQQYYRDESSLNDNGVINNSASFEFKKNISVQKMLK